jgi:hypothetical protein
MFEHARKPVGRVIVGIFIAGFALYIGIKGLLTGEVWVPSSKPWTTDGIQFGRLAGLSASLAYFFLGGLIHYIGFWKKGRLEDTRHDIAALLLLALCAAATLGFIVLSIADV